MSPTASEILRILAPEFAGSIERDIVISMADAFVPIDIPEAHRPTLVAYYAAHMFTISESQGAGGGVTARTEGSLSESYGGSGGAGGLRSTSYGQEYMRLATALRGHTARLGE